jgi:hypothetical protein
VAEAGKAWSAGALQCEARSASRLPEFTRIELWRAGLASSRRKRVAATRQFRVLVTAATPKSDVAYARG